jgi:glycosyltransferase involved in cell wall biosynthesis
MLPSPSRRGAVGLEFVFLGRLDGEQKGLDLLIEGLARSGLDEAILTLIGPDWRDGRRTLNALAQRLGVGARVRFAGPAFGPAKLALLSGPSIFVLTSRWEGLPFVVLEAACLGKAMLLTPAADPGSRFGPAGAALVVPGTASDVAAGLRTMAQLTPEQREALGRRARALVEAEFAWPAVAETMIEAYRRHCRAGVA